MKNPLILSKTHSTNDDAYEKALKGAEHGFGLIARSQDAGKGRLGKQWYSPPNTGLYCSIVLRPRLAFSEFSKLTLMAGLALCKTVEGILPQLSFGLKWPNDLHCKGLKCGGILVESSTPGSIIDNGFVVVGLGLNVNSTLDAFPAELQNRVTSLQILTGDYYDIEELYHRFHGTLLELLALQERQGFAPILKEWCKRDVLLGKEMQWLGKDKKILTATALGLDKDGQLLARARDGRVYEILSGDVGLAE